MSLVVTHARAHPRLIIAAGVGVAAALLLVGQMMLRADHHGLRRTAVAQGEGAGTVPAIVSVAAVVSLRGVVAELSAARQPGASHAVPQVYLALATVTGSWPLLSFAFNTAILAFTINLAASLF